MRCSTAFIEFSALLSAPAATAPLLKTTTTNSPSTAKSQAPPPYDTWYMTAHKDGCTCAAFSNDGRFIATGSSDTSLKVLDVSRLNGNKIEGSDGVFPFGLLALIVKAKHTFVAEKPVIRTYYDHLEAVRAVAFHPNGLVLASAGYDGAVKFFDLSRPTIKKGFRTMQVRLPTQYSLFLCQLTYSLPSRIYTPCSR